MIGRDTTASGTKTAQIAPPPSGPSAVRQRAGSAASDAAATATLPIVLLIGVALYFVWALLEQHERFRSAIQPKQIGINLRNLLVIMVTVVLGLNLFKVGAVKLSAFLGTATGGRVRLRWLTYIAGGA